MKLVNLEKVEFPGSPENAAVYERLKKHNGKKVVIIFRNPQSSRRGNITRHHGVIDGLWERGLRFSPPIHVPRKQYADVLIASVFYADLKQIEIKDQ